MTANFINTYFDFITPTVADREVFQQFLDRLSALPYNTVGFLVPAPSGAPVLGVCPEVDDATLSGLIGTVVRYQGSVAPETPTVAPGASHLEGILSHYLDPVAPIGCDRVMLPTDDHLEAPVTRLTLTPHEGINEDVPLFSGYSAAHWAAHSVPTVVPDAL